MYCGCGLQKSSAAGPARREHHQPIFIVACRAGSHDRQTCSIPREPALSNCMSYGGGAARRALASLGPQTPEVCDKCSAVTPVIR